MGTDGYEAEALDVLEQRFWREIWETAVPDAVDEHGIAIERFGPVQATAIADLPDQRWLNLVLGATAPGAVEGGHLEEAVKWIEGIGVDYYVPVTPGVPGTGAAEDWLNQRGYGHGYGWMKFLRDASPPDLPEPPGVEVFELAEGEGEGFSAIVAEGFGMPVWAGTLFYDLPGREGWHCYVAAVDGEAAGAAAMLAHGGIAEFGLAATLDSARGRGCQTALLRRRIADAAAVGCHTLFVETGERRPDRPEGSYRNILRAGFREAYLRPNWQTPAD
jgi:GNAT superfamily N-acetyltransferase